MKKYFISFIIGTLILSASARLFSQEAIVSKWNVGLSAGSQFTNISSPGLPSSPESEVGYIAGLFTEYQISQDFKIRIGLNFDKRAFSSHFTSTWFQFNDSVISRDSYSAYDFNYKLNYATIPLSFIYIKGVDKLKLFVQASVYYSLFLQAQQQGYTDVFIADSDFQYIDQEQYPNIKAGHNQKDFTGTTDKFLDTERFNSSDIGFNFFIGVIYDFSKKVGLYLSPGFTASFGRVLENPAYESKWTRIFKVEAGLVYHLK